MHWSHWTDNTHQYKSAVCYISHTFRIIYGSGSVSGSEHANQ